MQRGFRHSTKIEVRFADIDAMQHVNNAKYLTYIESARIRYFLDVFSDAKKKAPTFILAKAAVDFIVPITLHDEITVFTRCSRIGSKSFDLEYEIVKMNSGPAFIVAKAQTVLVAYDYKSQQSIVIPDEWKKEIALFEGREF